MTKHVKLRLTKGYSTLVDINDYLRISHVKWYAEINRDGSAYARNSKFGYLHRYITGTQGQFVVDHVNGNKLDNRRKNLRIATKQQNVHNSKPRKTKQSCRYKGVVRTGENKPCRRWEVRIVFDGKRRRYGRYSTALAAALAYDRLVIKLHREFAFLNFPERVGIIQRRK